MRTIKFIPTLVHVATSLRYLWYVARHFAHSDLTVDICVLTLSSIQDELRDGEDVARCPSCSLIIRVIFDPDDFQDEEEGETTFTIDTSITVS